MNDLIKSQTLGKRKLCQMTEEANRLLGRPAEDGQIRVWERRGGYVRVQAALADDVRQ